MKKFFLIIVLQALFFSAFSQKISGIVSDKKGTLPGATITLFQSEKIIATTVSDKNGKYEINDLQFGKYTIQTAFSGFYTDVRFLSIEKDVELNIKMEINDIYTEEVIISGTKASKNSPLSFTNIEKSDIDKVNFGQDIPYILDLTPSVVSTSDAGTGIGYTSMRIRGTDITRINVTLDGIPLNDSETHGVWWVDLPDFASSSDMIQIQRGAGTSTNGAAAFGANVGFYTNKSNQKPFAEISADYGTFNSQKYTLKSGTGLINEHFIFEGRVSKIHSDGFIDRAFSDLNSMQISGTYLDKKTSVKLNFLQGNEKTYQAWNGVPKDSLNSQTGRTFNSYTYENETDNYKQNHTQLFIKHNFSNNFSFNLAFHYTSGAGYYEQYKENQGFSDYGIQNLIIGTDTITETNLIRQKWIDNDFYGLIYSVFYKLKNINFNLGGSANNYSGDHFGNVIWTQYASNSEINYQYYFNNGKKIDVNNFFKLNYEIFPKVNFWADLQLRTINYTIDGIHDDLSDISQTHSFTFFNPKAGINYSPKHEENYYLSFSTANRAPSRSDYQDARTDKMPTPETLYDFESGYNFTGKSWSIHSNLYFMNYKDQLVLTGEINDVGAAIMVNVPKSYRAGIEIDGGVKFLKIFEFKSNITLSKNKILNFTAFVDDWDSWPVQREEFFKSTNISFSPEITSASQISAEIFKNFNVSFNAKYVGKQYIDNTSSSDRMLNPYIVNNLLITYSVFPKFIKKINLHLAINNVFNRQYETNAWVYRYFYNNEHYVLDGYFPQAGINFFMGLNLYF